MNHKITSEIPIPQYGVVRKAGILSSGLRVVVYEKPLAPIYVETSFQAGAAHEPEDKPGLAHFTEHLILSGTKRYPKKGELHDAFFENGAYLNAYTSRELLTIESNCAEEADMEFVFQNISEMITESIFDKDVVEKERGAILQEIKMKEANRGAMQAVKSDLLTYQKTRLARYVLGGEKSVSKISREELIQFADNMLVSDRMIIVVSGGTTFDAVARVLEKNSQLSKKRGTPFLPKGDLPVVREKYILINRVKGDEEVKIAFEFRIGNMHDTHESPIDIGGEVLTAGTKSRLYRRLRIEEGLVYGVGSGSETLIDSGSFGVETSCSRKNLQRVLDIITEELGKIRDAGVTGEEVSRLKERARKREKFRMQTADEWLSEAYTDLYSFEKNETILDRRARYHAVTPGDVKAAFEKYVKKDAWYLTLTGDVTEKDFSVHFE